MRRKFASKKTTKKKTAAITALIQRMVKNVSIKNVQMSDVVDNRPYFTLLTIFADKEEVHTMEKQRSSFQEYQCRHKTMDTIDVHMAKVHDSFN